jgi:predicted nuclease with RNAse H fold
VRALGIDVGVRKGLDLVLLDEGRAVLETERHVLVEDLAKLVPDLGADVVAIDAPPTWAANGRSRLTERELRWFGIQCFNTPSDERLAEHPFYEWMTIGFAAFEALADAFPRYRGGSVRGTAIEVFPHASAVVLAGNLPPTGISPHAWRREVLRTREVDASALRSSDQVDAALAALTGLYALERRFSAPGDPREGQIVLPSASLPAHPYRRGEPRKPGRDRQQPPLPGLAACACGDPRCTALTAREFAPGHDAKRKSALWALAREGQDALEELKRRGWAVPPELR